MIVIIDYGMGNSASILNMLQRTGAQAVISSELIDIERASALILPGVGAFDNAINKLQASGLADVLKNQVQRDKIPFMGICLGMQLLFDASEEGHLQGLGLIPGRVKRFSGPAFESGKLKVPHMGWNVVRPAPGEPLFDGLGAEPRFYFVHSYHVVCDNAATISATCEYGGEFTCAVHQDNIFAAQFHPEKSHKFGLQLFKNFLSLVS